MKAFLTENLQKIIEHALDRELETFSLNDRLFDELGMDSMGAALMMVEIEKATGIRISEIEVERLRTGKDIMALIETRSHVH